VIFARRLLALPLHFRLPLPHVVPDSLAARSAVQVTAFAGRDPFARRPFVVLAMLFLLFGTSSRTLTAQVPADSARVPRDTSLDSLRARLARAEAAIALLREQLGSESESAVHTRSRTRFEIAAQVLTNTFATYGRVNNVDVPQTALAPAPPGSTPASDNALGVTLRQTRIGAAAAVDEVLGATFSGDFDLDFFGGVQNGAGDRRLFPEPRLRTARARLTWPKTELLFGAETPLISDLNPISVASVGIPDFSGAGNLWNWLGQVRITREVVTTSRLHWAVQGAVMTPFSSTVAPGDPDAVDAGERSAIPGFEGRVRVRWGGDGEAAVSDLGTANYGGEIGVGMHKAWVATSSGKLQESHAVAVDAHAFLGKGVEIRGEAYTGRLLRGLGGGGIAQNYGQPDPSAPPNTLGPPIVDVAGWAQINVQPNPVVITGVGCGVDLADPDYAPIRRQNTACAAHLTWRPVQPLVAGFEYRQIGTRFSTGTYGARHYNLVLGFEL
jgi:hypothetical protein